MSAGVGYRSRAIDSVGALTPAHILEYSKLIDAGMVFKWDASGPAGMMQAPPLVNALPEFAYLAIDLQPAQLFIKRSRPGVTPPIWDAGPKMPDFTLQQFLDSEAASTQSAQRSAASATAASNSAASAAGSAGVAANIVATAQQNVYAAASDALQGAQQARLDAQYAQVASRTSAREAAIYAAEAIALIGVQIPAPIPMVLTSLLTAVMGSLPTSPPDGAGQPWLNNGTLAFTASTPEANAAAIAAANNVNQTQLNPAQVAVLLQGMAAGLPTDPPAGSGQPWLNNGYLTFTS